MAFYSYLPHVSPRTPPSPLPPATTWGACFCLKWIFVLSRLAGLGGGKQGYLAATIYYTGDFDSSPSDKARVDPEPPVIMGSRDDRERDRVMLGRGDEDRVDQTRVGVRGEVAKVDSAFAMMPRAFGLKMCRWAFVPGANPANRASSR